MNVVELLDETCARFPAAVALAWGLPQRGRTLSFGALAERSRRLASLFRREGLRAGDAVVIFVPASGPLYEVMAAALRLGLIPVFVEPARWRQSLDEALSRLPVRGFVGSTAACALRWFVPALRRLPHAFVAGAAFPGAISLSEADRCDPATPVEACSDATTALVTFTSGSGGRPKGVIRSHGTLLATHRALCGRLAPQPGEPSLGTLPFLVFVYLAAGAGAVIPELDLRRPGAADPEKLVRQIREWRVSGLDATPFLARGIAECCRQQGIRLESLRHVFTGGAPVLPELLEQLAAMAPGARVAAVYGATEAEPIAVAELAEFGPRERNAMREGYGVLVGRPVEGISARIVADQWGAPRSDCSTIEFEQACVRDGERGEIVVCGANVSSAYLGEDDNHRQKIVVEGVTWHRTGDAGRFDSTGRLWLAGRCAARMARNGDALYPLQVEAALSGVRGVACATMIEDSRGHPVLVIQPTADPPAVDMNELTVRLAWCRPHEVVIVDRMPLDARHHAKILYPEIRLALDRGRWRSRAPFRARS